MAHEYGNNEFVDMLLIYGEAHQNSAAAARLYAQRFPRRFHPLPQRFVALTQRARDTGHLQQHRGHDGEPGRPLRVLNAEEDILDLIEGDPTTSTCVIAHQVHVSNSVVWRTLREEQLYPFHVQRVQELLPRDHPHRVRFCEWLLEQQAINQDFTRNVLVTDEATFTRNGINNLHNTHVWAVVSVDIWAGIVNGLLIGPFVLPNRLTGRDYLHFLQNDLQELLEEVPLNIRRDMWFMHDGAPSHFRREVREYLSETFQDKWIGRGGPTSWPPRSPDLNPLDFYLWGHMKSLVNTSEINTLQELQQRIENAAVIIRQNGALLTSCTESWVRRGRLCLQSRSNNFEHLL